MANNSIQTLTRLRIVARYHKIQFQSGNNRTELFHQVVITKDQFVLPESCSVSLIALQVADEFAMMAMLGMLSPPHLYLAFI